MTTIWKHQKTQMLSKKFNEMKPIIKNISKRQTKEELQQQISVLEARLKEMDLTNSITEVLKRGDFNLANELIEKKQDGLKVVYDMQL